VGWIAGVLLLLWGAAHADDAVVNPGTAQHLGAAESGESVEISAPTDRYTAEEQAVIRDSAPDPHDIADLAPDTDFSLHDRDCECNRCCAEIEFYGPFPLASTHPPQQMFLTPVADTATVLGDGCGYYRLDLDVSSIITRELDSGIIADYDMETWRLTANYHRGIGDGGEVFASLPVLSRTPGVLDGIIRSWHGSFGLPNALRETLPDQQFHYVIVTRDGPVLNGSQGSGLGDLTVGYKHRLWDARQGRDSAALRAAVKLPTGDTGQYYGSGALDVSLGALYQRQLRKHLRAYVNYDYVFIGDPGLDNIEHQNIGSIMVATEYAVSHRTTLHGVYQAMVNPLRIGSREADKSPQQLSLGFSHRIGGRTIWSGGFTEDIYPETAPDFVLNTSLKWEY
jgi:Protein of unknown function (DUF3187)